MRPRIAAIVAAGLVMPGALALAPVAVADPTAPLVDHVEWAKWGDLSSLRIYPTEAARQLARQPGTAVQAWAEVLAAAPDADLPGMYEQFVCHWDFAEFAEPGKSSWNIEPWRPEVSPDQMLATGCNPGGTEEPF
ncbi:DUF2599 domain-containing protein [Mycobacterium sp. 21AC1]|uniref:DUF2599 domain-containing protein n=1 Tax=[Mycobacterium] appelbergii TaxID=2939269 RepID=UPI002939208A|nr:DUF2599 domain-containing protein [Mycobacterium sp. 21AC1]MDV3125604.1 DUF2599 domain-containing protein [Mycobacterium sp. 21AC1]